MSLKSIVQQNLELFNFWENVEIRQEFIFGKPARSLHPVHNDFEIVYPVTLCDTLSLKQIVELFEAATRAFGKRPNRILLGIVGDDGTVVYYFVHDGLVKPRKN